MSARSANNILSLAPIIPVLIMTFRKCGCLSSFISSRKQRYSREKPLCFSQVSIVKGEDSSFMKSPICLAEGGQSRRLFAMASMACESGKQQPGKSRRASILRAPWKKKFIDEEARTKKVEAGGEEGIVKGGVLAGSRKICRSASKHCGYQQQFGGSVPVAVKIRFGRIYDLPVNKEGDTVETRKFFGFVFFEGEDPLAAAACVTRRTALVEGFYSGITRYEVPIGGEVLEVRIPTSSEDSAHSADSWVHLSNERVLSMSGCELAALQGKEHVHVKRGWKQEQEQKQQTEPEEQQPELEKHQREPEQLGELEELQEKQQDEFQPPQQDECQLPQRDGCQPPQQDECQPPQLYECQPPQQDECQPPQQDECQPPQQDECQPPQQDECQPPQQDECQPPDYERKQKLPRSQAICGAVTPVTGFYVGVMEHDEDTDTRIFKGMTTLLSFSDPRLQHPSKWPMLSCPSRASAGSIYLRCQLIMLDASEGANS